MGDAVIRLNWPLRVDSNEAWDLADRDGRTMQVLWMP